MLEINYGVIATVAAAAAARTYMKFVRGPEPKKVDMSGKVSHLLLCTSRINTPGNYMSKTKGRTTTCTEHSPSKERCMLSSVVTGQAFS